MAWATVHWGTRSSNGYSVFPSSSSHSACRLSGCLFERSRESPVSEKKDWKKDSGISPTSSGNRWLPGQTLPSLKTLKAGARKSRPPRRLRRPARRPRHVALLPGVGAPRRAARDDDGAARALSSILLVTPAHRRPRRPAPSWSSSTTTRRPLTSCAWRWRRWTGPGSKCPCGSPTGAPSTRWGRWDGRGAPQATGSPHTSSSARPALDTGAAETRAERESAPAPP